MPQGRGNSAGAVPGLRGDHVVAQPQVGLDHAAAGQRVVHVAHRVLHGLPQGQRHRDRQDDVPDGARARGGLRDHEGEARQEARGEQRPAGQLPARGPHPRPQPHPGDLVPRRLLAVHDLVARTGRRAAPCSWPDRSRAGTDGAAAGSPPLSRSPRAFTPRCPRRSAHSVAPANGSSAISHGLAVASSATSTASLITLKHAATALHMPNISCHAAPRSVVTRSRTSGCVQVVHARQADQVGVQPVLHVYEARPVRRA